MLLARGASNHVIGDQAKFKELMFGFIPLSTVINCLVFNNNFYYVICNLIVTYYMRIEGD